MLLAHNIDNNNEMPLLLLKIRRLRVTVKSTSGAFLLKKNISTCMQSTLYKDVLDVLLSEIIHSRMLRKIYL
jgi:hypothetical protein